MNQKRLKNLAVGRRFKNYPELCEFLGEKTFDGTSKKAQIKEWERHFKFEKNGHEFIIKDVYIETKEKESNKGIYRKYVEKLILDLLCKENILKERRFYGTLNQILEDIYAINHCYIDGQTDAEVVTNLTLVDSRYVDEFYNITYPNFRNMIETALNSLKGKGVLWEKHIFVAVHENGSEIHREATEEEKSEIAHCLTITLKEMKLDDLYQVYTNRRVKEFKYKISKHFSKCSNIIYYYNSYGIYFSELIVEYRDKLEKTIQKHLLEQEQKEKLGLELNEIIRNEIVKNADKREQNFIKENAVIKDGESFIFSDNIRGSGVYTQNIKTLTNTLIKHQ